MKHAKFHGAVHHRGSQYPVVVQEDVASGYWVSCPVLEGCYSQGETIEDALKNIREAIVVTLEAEAKQRRREPVANVSLHFVSV